jgi:hypothetical protein
LLRGGCSDCRDRGQREQECERERALGANGHEVLPEMERKGATILRKAGGSGTQLRLRAARGAPSPACGRGLG